MRNIVWVLAVGMVSIGVTFVASARAESRSVRDRKGGAVNFHLASTTPIKGYDKISPGVGNGVLYVSPRPVWTGSDVVLARTTDSPGGPAMEFTLSAEAAERLTTRLRHQSGDRVAIYADGKVVSSGILRASSSDGRATITGLTAVNTERVLKLINGEQPMPAPSPTTIGAVVSLVPVGQSDGLYPVDVYVQGVSNLRSYQIGLQVSGGDGGELVREDLRIDEGRPDFVFRDLDVIAAADPAGGRLAGVLIDGGVDKATAAYLGTYAFRATPDASGTFQVSIDAGAKSFLADSQNEMTEFRSGPAVLITIGGGPTQRTNEK